MPRPRGGWFTCRTPSPPRSCDFRLLREGEAPAEPSRGRARQEPRPPKGRRLMLTTTTTRMTHDESPATPFPPIPRRPLGRTGHDVTQFALGGEGVLRTHGRMAEAVAVIHRALDQGVNY